MTLSLTIERSGRLVAALNDGPVDVTVSSAHGRDAAAVLADAVEQACDGGYGECFWSEPTGQYWWMLRRDNTALEVVVLWSSGAVTGWQHVFRATDDASRFRTLVRDQTRGRAGAS